MHHRKITLPAGVEFEPLGFSKNLAANDFSHYVTLKNDTDKVAQKHVVI